MKKRVKSAMSIGQKLLPILIFSALFGLKGFLVVIETHIDDTEALLALSSVLVTNAIYILLLMFTKIFD